MISDPAISEVYLVPIWHWTTFILSSQLIHTIGIICFDILLICKINLNSLPFTFDFKGISLHDDAIKIDVDMILLASYSVRSIFFIKLIKSVIDMLTVPVEGNMLAFMMTNCYTVQIFEYKMMTTYDRVILSVCFVDLNHLYLTLFRFMLLSDGFIDHSFHLSEVKYEFIVRIRLELNLPVITHVDTFSIQDCVDIICYFLIDVLVDVLIEFEDLLTFRKIVLPEARFIKSDIQDISIFARVNLVLSLDLINI